MRSPRTGTGRFQWNAGGWFGAQLGSTLWLAILGTILLRSAPREGVILLLCFLLPNAIGAALWMRRDRVPPFAGILALVGAAGAAALVGAFVTQRPGLDLRDDWRVPPSLVLGLFGGLLVFFFVLERSARRGRATTP